jgi:hypothetical protein
MAFCAMHGLTQRRRELEAAGEFDYVERKPKASGSARTIRAPRSAWSGAAKGRGRGGELPAPAPLERA